MQHIIDLLSWPSLLVGMALGCAICVTLMAWAIWPAIDLLLELKADKAIAHDDRLSADTDRSSTMPCEDEGKRR